MTVIERTWTDERLELLKLHFAAGLSCAQIANEIGVSRNAVIGKIHRLGYARTKAAGAPKRAYAPRVRHGFLRPRLVGQRHLLRLLHRELQTPVEAIPSAQRCSLLDLGPGKCRWPISEPGAADFAFCGNVPAAGFPYCAGHARLAYRHSGQQRRA